MSQWRRIDGMVLKQRKQGCDVDLLKLQFDDLSAWAHRDMFLIDDIAMLYVGIDPARYKNLYEFLNDESFDAFDDSRQRRAKVYKEMVLDGIFIGSLAAHLIVAWVETDRFTRDRRIVNQLEITQYHRNEIDTSETYILKTVLFNWMANKKIKSLSQERRERKKAQQEEDSAKEKIPFMQLLFPNAPLLKEVDRVQRTYWVNHKEGDKPPLQKTIVDGLMKDGHSKVKALAIDAVASPILRQDRSNPKG